MCSAGSNWYEIELKFVGDYIPPNAETLRLGHRIENIVLNENNEWTRVRLEAYTNEHVVQVYANDKYKGTITENIKGTFDDADFNSINEVRFNAYNGNGSVDFSIDNISLYKTYKMFEVNPPSDNDECEIPLRRVSDQTIRCETPEGSANNVAANVGYVNTMIDDLGKTTLVDGKQVVTTGINHSIKKPLQPTSELLYSQKENGTYKCIIISDLFEDDIILVADWYNNNYVTEVEGDFNQPIFIPSHITKVNISHSTAVIFDENSRLTDFAITNGQLETLVLPASIKNVKDNMFSNCVPTTLVFKGTPDSIGTSLSNSEGCKDIYVPWSESDPININAPWGFTNASIHYDFPVDVFNMDGSWKTLDDYIDSYTNGDTAKVIKNMKRIDEEGLAKGWYDKAALEKFQNSFNRVYVEQSKNRGIYAKVALTASGKFEAQPTDYDIDDQEIPYYLGSIPTRLNGSEKDPDFGDADTRYRVGHIKVPPVDVDNFPTVDEANEFATSKLYVDTAIDKKIEENNNTENIYYSPDIDNRSITVSRDGSVDNKSTELYINKDYKIDSTTDNYFKFKTNFKWSVTDNSQGDFYFCIRDSGGLRGYIYLNLKDNTIKTKARSTKLNLNAILPQNE